EVGGLLALDGIADNDIWAVGAYSSAGTLIEHWDGASWSIEPSPSGGILRAVSADAANDAWAVGEYGPNNRTLVEHWDGSQWSVIPSPNPGTYHYLQGVTAIS